GFAVEFSIQPRCNSVVGDRTRRVTLLFPKNLRDLCDLRVMHSCLLPSSHADRGSSVDLSALNRLNLIPNENLDKSGRSKLRDLHFRGNSTRAGAGVIFADGSCLAGGHGNLETSLGFSWDHHSDIHKTGAAHAGSFSCCAEPAGFAPGSGATIAG